MMGAYTGSAVAPAMKDPSVCVRRSCSGGRGGTWRPHDDTLSLVTQVNADDAVQREHQLEGLGVHQPEPQLPPAAVVAPEW